MVCSCLHWCWLTLKASLEAGGKFLINSCWCSSSFSNVTNSQLCSKHNDGSAHMCTTVKVQPNHSKHQTAVTYQRQLMSTRPSAMCFPEERVPWIYFPSDMFSKQILGVSHYKIKSVICDSNYTCTIIIVTEGFTVHSFLIQGSQGRRNKSKVQP